MNTLKLALKRTSILTIKRSNTIEIIASLFILLFVYTGVSKLSDIDRFQDTLLTSPLVGKYNLFFSWAIPIWEVLVSVALFMPQLRKIGMWAGMLTMAAFTIYVGYMIAFAPHLPCSCGGVVSKMSWKQHLWFNAGYTLLGIIGLIMFRNEAKLAQALKN